MILLKKLLLKCRRGHVTSLLIGVIIIMFYSCISIPSSHFLGFKKSSYFNEQVKMYTFDPGVRILIDAPRKKLFGIKKPTRIVFYALPNGNTIEQTFGKKVKEDVDWHFGIQHIGAQTRRLREIIKDENIIVAYLEAEGKSWPSWRGKYENNRELIPKIIESIKQQVNIPDAQIELSAHSGGGSFIFGYINNVEKIPSAVRRIIFLDANYSFSNDEKHGEKLLEWLKSNPDNHLVIIAYDDREITLNGKKVLGPTGGTFRATHRMIERLEKDIKLDKRTEGDIEHYKGLNEQIDIIIHLNPKNEILHTVLVEKNGFIHSLTLGTKYENKAGIFRGPIEYTKWIQED